MSIFRKIRTVQEARAVGAALERGIQIRPKRNCNRLPNSFDDPQRGRRGRTDRYKNHRRA